MASSATSSTASVSDSHHSSQPISHSPSPDQPTDAANLDVLIGHLLASKRSLNSVTHLHRASTIISEARATLESTAVVSARSVFIQRNLTSQLGILESVHSKLASFVQQGQADFAAWLRDLDDADAQLEAAISGLRNTHVERAFRPDEEGEKTLLDFVDENPVEETRESLRNAIDGLNEAIGVLERESGHFHDELADIKDALSSSSSGSGKANDSMDSFKVKPPSLASVLRGMEEHAKEMALGLESLVRHFDLCVTAIRHTEGGGAAAQNLAVDFPEGLDMHEHALNLPAQSISPEEHAEMLSVLHNDAQEVEEVVIEIQDRISEMEVQLSQIQSHHSQTIASSTSTHTAFSRIENLAKNLPHYTSQIPVFLAAWESHETSISESLISLNDLASVYANFLTAYSGLILEVDRRKRVSHRMHSIVRNAQAELESLHQQDAEEREAFRLDMGDYLPSDIWPGLAAPPTTWTLVKEVGGAGTEDADASGSSIPALPKERIEEAKRMLREASQYMK